MFNLIALIGVYGRDSHFHDKRNDSGMGEVFPIIKLHRHKLRYYLLRFHTYLSDYIEAKKFISL